MSWHVHTQDEDPENTYKFRAFVSGSLAEMQQLATITTPYWLAGGQVYWTMIGDNEAKFCFVKEFARAKFCDCAWLNLPMDEGVMRAGELDP